MSATSNVARITVARFDRGFCLRIEGPGTMSESPVMHAFAERVLSGPEGEVVVDLGACTYVDSTFLGNRCDRTGPDLGGAAIRGLEFLGGHGFLLRDTAVAVPRALVEKRGRRLGCRRGPRRSDGRARAVRGRAGATP